MFAARLPTTTTARAVLSQCTPKPFARYESSFRAESSSPLERRKHPRRGGQNLSDRFNRLEKSLRGKSSLTQKLEQRMQHFTKPEPMTTVSTTKARPVQTFKGFTIPKKPRPPEPDECCMSGCAVCVYDLYQESLDKYNDDVKSLRASLSAMKIPQSQWPKSIRTNADEPPAQRQASVMLSAFEELERRLKEKHKAEASAEGTKDRAAPLVSVKQRRRSSRVALPSWESLYEGARWLLFSNR